MDSPKNWQEDLSSPPQAKSSQIEEKKVAANTHLRTYISCKQRNERYGSEEHVPILETSNYQRSSEVATCRAFLDIATCETYRTPAILATPRLRTSQPELDEYNNDLRRFIAWVVYFLTEPMSVRDAIEHYTIMPVRHSPRNTENNGQWTDTLPVSQGEIGSLCKQSFINLYKYIEHYWGWGSCILT